jgi:hypothetical protein
MFRGRRQRSEDLWAKVAYPVKGEFDVGIMELQGLRDRIETIRAKREALIRLLEQPDLGTLRIDVNQALEEMDDLLEEFDRTFPSPAG